jgi:DNA ligase-associated metallophosphoesterase
MRFLRKQPAVSSTKREALADRRPARLRLGGVELEPDISGALYMPDYAALLVADLHLEKGSSFATRGLHIPPYDTRSTLAALEAVIERRKPQRLVSLGDSFHDARAGERLDEGDLARLRRLCETLDVCWLIGNHDPVLPRGLGGRIASEISLGPLTLRHLPRSRLGSEIEIAGHLHPVASISRRGRKITLRSFVAGSRRLIMPAFGAYTGGLNVSAPEIASLFDQGTFTAWMIGRRAVYGFSSLLLD